MAPALNNAVDRLNTALGSTMLPADDLRGVTSAADTDLTLEQAFAESERVALPDDKTARYGMYVRLANGFWNTVKDIVTQTSLGEGGQARFQAGERATDIPAAGYGQDGPTLDRILLLTTDAYGRELEDKLRSLPGPVTRGREYFSHACERVLSGSFEGGMLVTEVMKTLLKHHAEKVGSPLSPDDLDRNAATQLSAVKKIMRLNIVADEFLDALMYGNVDIFTCEDTSGPEPSYTVTLRQDIVDMLEAVAVELCQNKIGGELDITELFEEIHSRLRASLSHRHEFSSTEAQSGIFLGAMRQLQEQLDEAGEDSTNSIRLLQGLELSFMARKANVPIETWPPEHREFMMTAMLLKSVISWHTEPNIRTVSGCPMLYSRMLPEWYEKLTGAMRDWYRTTLQTPRV